MSATLSRRARLAVALLAMTVVPMAEAAPQSPAPATIAPDSPLLHIDPAEVACGRPAIALMDATRTTTGWDHRKFPAFKVVGNTYSVGISAVTAYLIRTSDGLILIDTTFDETAPWVAESIEKLGFKLDDIKIILGSHAHLDHQGGSAWMKTRVPGAKLMIMEGDAETVEKGAPGVAGIGRGMPPVKVDQVLRDGDKVTLGDVTVLVWKTAGHTPGASSFEWKTTENGETYDVLLMGSQQAAEKLVPEGYPGIVKDQIEGWEKLLSLKPDVWFGGHPWQHNNVDKYEAMLAEPGSNPFIDPKGYRCLVAARAFDFVEELKKQEAAAAKGGK
ncbi:MAG: metallo-beta-lactamase [Sphingopyxis sp.]|nr:metallo-beta-lactamase [Sphingopyxis sp.]